MVTMSSLRNAFYKGYHFSLTQLNHFSEDGTNIFDRDWDLLIILDACRVDLMKEVADEYEFIKDIQTIRSVNSATAAWMRDTFPDRTETGNTTYICGNPFSESELERSWFAELIEIWQTAWTDPGTVSPRPITDQVVHQMRNKDRSPVIAHYMQPHCPFIPAPELSKGKV